MDLLEAHQRAQDAFAPVLVNVDDRQLDDPTPCREWDVQALIGHVIGGNGWVRTRAGLEPLPLPEDRVRAHAESAAGAQAVFVAPDGLTRMFELPIGTIPGVAFIGIRTVDVLTHAWDLARATGQPTDLDDELATEALEVSKQRIAPSFRGPGRPFGAEEPCPEGGTSADQLAAFLGRVVQRSTTARPGPEPGRLAHAGGPERSPRVRGVVGGVLAARLGDTDCEAFRGGFWSQPANSVSSLAYLVVGGLFLAWVVRRPRGQRLLPVVYGCLIVANGIGGVLFHGPAWAGSGWIHDMALTGALLFIVVFDVSTLRKMNTIQVLGAFAVLMGFIGLLLAGVPSRPTP